MRYLIFPLLILLNSCTLFRHQPEQEKVTAKEPVRTTTLPAETIAQSKPVIDTIPGAVVIDPSLVTVSLFEGVGPWMSGPTSYYEPYFTANFFPQIFLTSVVTNATIDSVHIQPGEGPKAISATPAKFISKSAAAVFPETKTSIIPYIVCGIAAVFLSTLLLAFLKRKKKNIDLN